MIIINKGLPFGSQAPPKQIAPFMRCCKYIYKK